MNNRIKNILALLIILIPFYLVAVVQKMFLDQSDYLIHDFFGMYMLLGMVGISVILLLNTYYLKNNWNAFASKEGNAVVDMSFAMVLISAYYFVEALSMLSYGQWIQTEMDRTHMDQLLFEIFDNPLYALLMVGPFSWINEVFSMLSIAFILNNLWTLKQSKTWTWIAVLLTGLLFGLLQIDQGWREMIDSFIIISIFGFAYLKYRRIYPLLIAAIIIESIELITYWVYVA